MISKACLKPDPAQPLLKNLLYSKLCLTRKKAKISRKNINLFVMEISFFDPPTKTRVGLRQTNIFINCLKLYNRNPK